MPCCEIVDTPIVARTRPFVEATGLEIVGTAALANLDLWLSRFRDDLTFGDSLTLASDCSS